ncbi:hypothetical protein ABID99_003582 [Mucilaginibacter sp. OAE612]
MEAILLDADDHFSRITQLSDENYFIARQDLEPFLVHILGPIEEFYIIFLIIPGQILRA